MGDRSFFLFGFGMFDFVFFLIFFFFLFMYLVLGSFFLFCMFWDMCGKIEVVFGIVIIGLVVEGGSLVLLVVGCVFFIFFLFSGLGFELIFLLVNVFLFGNLSLVLF